jgi:hypothetical protein
LTSAREHPPARAVRQHQQDVGILANFARDLNNRQTELLLLLWNGIRRYQPPALQVLADRDVEDAARALASTFETASSGIIYEHRADSAPAERLAAFLRPQFSEAAARGGSGFERDAAVALRRLESGLRELREKGPETGRAFLDLLERVLDRIAPQDGDPAGGATDTPRLIVP